MPQGKELPPKLAKDLAACKFRQRRVPFPAGVLAPSTASASRGIEEKRQDERKLLEEILGRQPSVGLRALDDRPTGLSALQTAGEDSENLPQPRARKQQPQQPQPRGRSEPDVLSSMARRLSTVERANKQLRADALEQNKELLALRRENERLKLAVGEADEADAHADGDAVAHVQAAHVQAEQHAHPADEADDAGAGGGMQRLLVELAEQQCANSALEEQLADMKRFLSDYGLVWVGDRGGSARAGSEADTQGSRAEAKCGAAGARATDGGRAAAGARAKAGDGADGQAGFSFDFDLFFEGLERLNSLAGAHIAKVTAEGGVHKLKCPEGIPLAVYRDGLFLQRGPLRAYAARHTQAFVNDVMDGYYPTEFREEYPDGVVFRVTDNRTQCHGGGAGGPGSFRAFGGAGNRLRAETKEGGDGAAQAQVKAEAEGKAEGRAEDKAEGKAESTAEGRGRDGTASALCAEAKGRSGCLGGSAAQPSKPRSLLCDVGPEELPMGRDRFLEALPSAIVGGGGRVVPVRGAIAELLGGGTAGAGASAGGAAGAKGAAGPVAAAAGERVTTLRVRSDDGMQVLVLNMQFDDTVADLRAAIDARRGGGSAYQLRTAFPNRVHSDGAQTLLDAGLTPNAQLMLRVTV
eukprot:g6952.t1